MKLNCSDPPPTQPALKLDNYLNDLVIEDEGTKGNDFIRLYEIRGFLRGILIDKFKRKDVVELLGVNKKKLNHWIGDSKQDVGIPVSYALKLMKMSNRSEHELFDKVTYFGCMNSKKYKLPKYLTP